MEGFLWFRIHVKTKPNQAIVQDIMKLKPNQISETIVAKLVSFGLVKDDLLSV